jgi:hypothetical protein
MATACPGVPTASSNAAKDAARQRLTGTADQRKQTARNPDWLKARENSWGIMNGFRVND